MEALLWHIKQAAIAINQLANALLGGWADETLSSRAYRWDKDGIRAWPRKVIDWLAARLGDVDHCHESYRSERRGLQLPPELRPRRGRRGHNPGDCAALDDRSFDELVRDHRGK